MWPCRDRLSGPDSGHGRAVERVPLVPTSWAFGPNGVRRMQRPGLATEVVDASVYAAGGTALPRAARSSCPPSRSWPTRRTSRPRSPPTSQRPIRTLPDPRNLFRVHWHNAADRRGIAAVARSPRAAAAELTGVEAPIVVALADRFPMIASHKVLAAYACLAPRIVTGQFDPTLAARRLAVDRQLLPRRRGDQPDHGLPRRGGAARGHERRALRVAGALGRRPVRHHPHAGHGEQREGDLRPLRASSTASRTT